MEPKQHKGFFYGYVIVACCCLIMAVNAGLAMSCAGVFYTSVSEEIGVSVGVFALYMSCNFLASTLMLSVAGRMMERMGARLMLTLSSGMMGVCFLAMSRFHAVWQFYLAGAVLGISLAFLYYLSFPTLINRWFRSRVGLYMGVCSAAMGLGGALFSPVCAWLIADYGWRTAYALLGALVLLGVTPLLGLLLRNAPARELPPGAQAAAEPRPRQEEGVPHAQALRMPVFYLLVVYAFLVNGTAPMCLIMPSYVEGLSTLENAGRIAAAVMLGVAVGKVALGIINDKSPVAGVMLSTLLGVVGLAALALAPQWCYEPGAFLFGWAFAGVSVQTPLLTRTVFGRRDYPLIYSKISIALAAGGTLAAGGWGILAEHTSYHFVFLLGGVFLLVCLGLGLYALRSQRQRV